MPVKFVAGRRLKDCDDLINARSWIIVSIVVSLAN